MRGKVIRIQPHNDPIEDHPRLCGEKSGISFNPFTYTGSPPPMRGKEATNETIKVGQGITPAYAGKSLEKVKAF